jgi:hypothetical protein
MRGRFGFAVALALTACPKEPEPGPLSDGTTIGVTTVRPATEDASTAATPTDGGPTTDSPTSPGETTSDPTTGVASTGSTGSTGTATTMPATDGGSSTSTGTTGEPGKWFDCYGCMCDADEFYCQQVFNGVVKPRDRECEEVRPDALDNGCAAYPDSCGATPTCACLPVMGGLCYCTEVEDGVFEVVCPLP